MSAPDGQGRELRKPVAPIRQKKSPARWHSDGSHIVGSPIPEQSHGILSRELFAKTLFRERKRTERSGGSFVLMLLESAKLLRRGNRETINGVLSALGDSARDTDIMGWYKEGSTIGVIFTELGAHAEGDL